MSSIVYEETGGEGASQSSVGIRTAAIHHFDTFLKNIGWPVNYDSIPVGDLCSQALFRQFATYLCTDAVNKF